MVKFKGQFETANFKTILSGLAQLVYEGKFEIKKDGLHLQSTISGKDGVVWLHIKKEAFKNYEYEEDMQFIVVLNKLNEYIKRAGREITLATDGDKVAIKSIETGKIFRTRTLAKIPEKSVVPKLSDYKPEVTIKVPINKLTEAISDAGIVSETIQLIANEKGVRVKSSSEQNVDSVDVKISDEKFTKETSSRFGLEVLNKMASTGVGFEAIIDLGNDYPIRLTYNTDTENLVFIYAPRVVSEGD